MTLDNYMKEIIKFNTAFSCSKDPYFNFTLLQEELGEFAETIVKNKSKLLQEQELADALFVLLGMAYNLDYDLPKALDYVAEKNAQKVRNAPLMAIGKGGKVIKPEDHEEMVNPTETLQEEKSRASTLGHWEAPRGAWRRRGSGLTKEELIPQICSIPNHRCTIDGPCNGFPRNAPNAWEYKGATIPDPPTPEGVKVILKEGPDPENPGWLDKALYYLFGRV